MKHLVLKDIRIIGFINIILALVALVVGTVGVYYQDLFKSNAIYIIPILIGTYLIVMTLTNKDVLYNVQPLLISIPTKRFDIVKARYLTVFSYILFLVVTISLSSNISKLVFRNINGSPFGLIPMIFTISLLLVFLSITIPIQYYDTKKAQIINILLYMFIILFPNVYNRLGLDFINSRLLENIAQLNFKIITPIVFIISLSMYIASLFISKTLYSRKEF
ncbi:ABC-2 transporter permease [Tissierella creatinophila]|uniref:ABC-2 family transporter protein n=1 Tax=Tissierella creatinophila DSM 6911 TaxID=1123403 RepID=A0A1U7M4T7_TISCR|nr:ABC-2 transporter permease [Tissierella creatinophila]OLS02295.1 hypothetical protein TICRE_16810 [Tissierella creatinophila DSM 6911]